MARFPRTEPEVIALAQSMVSGLTDGAYSTISTSSVPNAHGLAYVPEAGTPLLLALGAVMLRKKSG